MFSVLVLIGASIDLLSENTSVGITDKDKESNLKLSIEEVNRLPSDDFVNIFENVVEFWPKAAETIATQRPFTSVAELVSHFSEYIENLSEGEKITILQLHPDLAGTFLDDTKLSAESANEQASAGLDKLTAEERTQLVQMNAEYSRKFGFPFVISVRQSNKIDAILNGLQKRLPNIRTTEIVNGIEEVKKICQSRIEDIVK